MWGDAGEVQEEAGTKATPLGELRKLRRNTDWLVRAVAYLLHQEGDEMGLIDDLRQEQADEGTLLAQLGTELSDAASHISAEIAALVANTANNVTAADVAAMQSHLAAVQSLGDQILAIDPGAPPAVDPVVDPVTGPPVDPNAPPAVDPAAPPVADPNAPPAVDPNAPPAPDPFVPLA